MTAAELIQDPMELDDTYHKAITQGYCHYEALFIVQWGIDYESAERQQYQEIEAERRNEEILYGYEL